MVAEQNEKQTAGLFDDLRTVKFCHPLSTGIVGDAFVHGSHSEPLSLRWCFDVSIYLASGACTSQDTFHGPPTNPFRYPPEIIASEGFMLPPSLRIKPSYSLISRLCRLGWVDWLLMNQTKCNQTEPLETRPLVLCVFVHFINPFVIGILKIAPYGNLYEPTVFFSWDRILRGVVFMAHLDVFWSRQPWLITLSPPPPVARLE